MMRAVILLIPFAVDVVLKVLVRISPDALGRFSFLTSVGTIGLAPSVNTVLAFSLPVPNQYIWPVGWVVVLWLAWVAFRRCRALRRNGGAPASSDGVGDAARIGVVNRFRSTTIPLDDTSSDTANDGRQRAITAIILGAFSNLTDRTFLGGVTDYLSLTNLFPAFNIADLLIIGGIVGWMHSAKRM